MLEYILELIYPTTCGICGKICKDGICKKCELKLKKYEINLIYKKDNCKYMHVYRYCEVIRKKIIDYKFNNKPYLYKTFSKILLKNKKICGFLKNYDIIIPVPIHKNKKIKRGYNQTELIAKEISKNTHLKLVKDVLIKKKDTKMQSSLKKEDRVKNVKHAFCIKNSEKIFNKNVLLFDDIYTTGSTAKECIKVLKGAKVNKIGIITIAKD